MSQTLRPYFRYRYFFGRTVRNGVFTEKTSAAIMVLMGFLILMNALAVYLRKRFELK